MIVGADDASDRSIIETSANLYSAYHLKRIYYSAFSPIPDASAELPLIAPPLVREHRLYQADWLMRFYGFAADEIPTAGAGMLALDIDPKLAWALAHRERFPVDLNRADREALLRVPGLGVKTVQRIIAARRVRAIGHDDLVRLRVPLRKVLPFVIVRGARPSALLDSLALEHALRTPPEQLALFGAGQPES
jgi:predicted DNA-binding helix-hairpin-helix protein